MDLRDPLVSSKILYLLCEPRCDLHRVCPVSNYSSVNSFPRFFLRPRPDLFLDGGLRDIYSIAFGLRQIMSVIPNSAKEANYIGNASAYLEDLYSTSTMAGV